MLFRGREIAHPEFGKELLTRFLEEVKDLIVLEQAPRLEGRNMVMILAPKA
ncbi:MAG: translation initiation factor IF-3 C-terminal domain-containing protein [Deltaproteobacteria bacterium]|nr:translation initiation factor IF-3 C-terminal domain-containing protein [Deltaproteobacteria bacterium]